MNAESVKARLKNFAKCTGYTFQEALTYYGLEVVQGGAWQPSPPHTPLRATFLHE